MAEQESVNDAEGDYLKSNADFFIQAFSSLLNVYDASKTMNILSEEEILTLAIGMEETDEEGVMDVNCVKFEPNQESPRVCFDRIF